MAPCVSLFERPTLPSLHTLDLPVPLTQSRQKFHAVYDSYEAQSCPPLNVHQHWPYARQVSVSSSCSSRSPSPNPSNYSSNSRTDAHSPPPPLYFTRSSPTPKLRLIPSTLAVADAVVVVPPPTTPFIPAISSTPPIETARQGQALLLVGPALQHFRHPKRQIAKGARIHPYRIIKGGDNFRRTSPSCTLSV